MIHNNEKKPQGFDVSVRRVISGHHSDKAGNKTLVASLIVRDISSYTKLDAGDFSALKTKIKKYVKGFVVEKDLIGFVFPEFANYQDIENYIYFLDEYFEEKFPQWLEVVKKDISQIEDPSLDARYENTYKHCGYVNKDNASSNAETPARMEYYLSKAINTYNFLDPEQKQLLKSTLERVISQFAGRAKELKRLADVYTKAWRIHTDVARGFKPVAELGKVQRVVGGDALVLIAYRGTPQQVIYNSVFGKIPILEQQGTEQTADEAAGDSREASPEFGGLKK